MWEKTGAGQVRTGRVSALLGRIGGRGGALRPHYKVGEVLIGDDPFTGRRHGRLAVVNRNSVGLEVQNRIYFYDHRQVRRPG